MLGLPRSTEIHRALPKTQLFSTFAEYFTPARRRHFDANVSRISFVNELSSHSLRLPEGEAVASAFVLHILVKSRTIDKNNLSALPRLMQQNLLMVLECDGQFKLALYRDRLFETDWQPAESFQLPVVGLNTQLVWENIIRAVVAIPLDAPGTLDEQIALQLRRNDLKRQIEKLERKARTEKQPRTKLELIAELRQLKEELDAT